MSLFDIPLTRGSKERDKKILEQKNPSANKYTAGITVASKGSGSLIDRVSACISFVKSKFKGKEDTFILIQDEETLHKYIDRCIENNVISIDTETTGLDPILDHIVGLCIYTPNMKAAYVPIEHVSYITGVKCKDQLDKSIIAKELQRLVDAETRTIFFNAPFDVRVIKNSLGVFITPYFDASVAAHTMNTEESAYKLKPLHDKYCCGGKENALSFGSLFDGLPFDIIPINIAYLYASNDAIITYELYRFYAQWLEPDGEHYNDPGITKLSDMFFNIEMKSMPTFIAMEQYGVAMDYARAPFCLCCQ